MDSDRQTQLVERAAEAVGGGSRGYLAFFHWSSHFPFKLVLADDEFPDDQDEYPKKVSPGSPGYVTFNEIPRALLDPSNAFIETTSRKALISNVLDWKNWSEEEVHSISASGKKYTQVMVTCRVPQLSPFRTSVPSMFEFILSVLQDVMWLCRGQGILSQLHPKVARPLSELPADRRHSQSLESVQPGEPEFGVVGDRKDKFDLFRADLVGLGICPLLLSVFQVNNRNASEIISGQWECICDPTSGEESLSALDDSVGIIPKDDGQLQDESNDSVSDGVSEDEDVMDVDEDEDQVEMKEDEMGDKEAWDGIQESMEKAKQRLERAWNTTLNENDATLTRLRNQYQTLHKQQSKLTQKLSKERNVTINLWKEFNELKQQHALDSLVSRYHS